MNGTEGQGLPLPLIFLVAAGLFLLVTVGLIWLWYFISERERAKKSLNMITMQIRVPKETERAKEDEAEPLKDFRELMSISEQLFSSLSSLYDNSLKAKIFGHDPIVFEIQSVKDEVTFSIACVEKDQVFLEKQIHSFYPNAQIDIIEGKNIFEDNKGAVAAGILKLNKRFIFPIKTYRNLESDPLNAITNALSKLGPKASAAIQIVIIPTNEYWRLHTASSAYSITQGKGHLATLSPAARVTAQVFEGLGTAMSGATGGAQAMSEEKQNVREKKMERLTPQQEEMMKMFNEKSNKVGFKTMVRIVTTAEDEQAAKASLDSIAAAFGQFTWPQGNSFHLLTNSKVSVIMTDCIYKFFCHAPTMLLNAEELASMFHFPNRNCDTPNIVWLYSRSLPPPVDLPDKGIAIGKSIYRGQEKLVRITDDDRRRHLFMIGKTGVGKTTFFEYMIDQDIKNGAGLCFIDPLGDAIEGILNRIPKERADDVVLFDPADTDWPMGLNLLEYKDDEERDFLIQEVIAIFYKLFDPNQQGIVGPQWEHWARNAMLTLMSDPEGGTLIEIPKLFTDDAFRQKKISYVTDPVVKAFWEQQLAKTADFHKSEMYNYFISKFGRFMTNELMRNIIGQKKSAFNLREMMDNGKILLINLAKGKIGEINSNLLGMILVSKIQVAAFSRADIPEETRKDFYLYVDEFQNFTTETFATILSEARKYRLCLNITNQYIAQLTEKIRDAVIGNAGSIVTYRIGAADAEFLEKELPGVTVTDMTNLDKFHLYVKLLINLRPSKPFSMKGLKSDIPSDPKLAEEIRQLSRLKYARDRFEVEKEILGGNLEQKQSVAAGTNGPMSRL